MSFVEKPSGTIASPTSEHEASLAVTDEVLRPIEDLALYVAELMQSIGDAVSATVVASYLKRTEQWPRDKRIDPRAVAWFFAPGDWGQPNRATVYSRVWDK